MVWGSWEELSLCSFCARELGARLESLTGAGGGPLNHFWVWLKRYDNDIRTEVWRQQAPDDGGWGFGARGIYTPSFWDTAFLDGWMNLLTAM